ncbi:TetR/AcrR family transcriptional regulator [Saccharothrix sp. NPDC042600]|uniref:TetR/AcrR family transcriptional regulator n=1 Tax=Saccharothrix TaxID=2071 RepID=UPI0033EDBD74
MSRLTHARIVDAAARVADRGGLTRVSMRNVGRELGVEAMSLYHHLKGKEALLDALADWIFVRIELPDPATPWRAAMTARATSARAVLSEHTWGLGLVESRRSPGPASLRHHDGVLGCLRHNGFPVALAASAFSVLDAYVYGFVLTELNLPFQAGESAEEFVAQVDLPADRYPHLTEMVAEQVLDRDYSYGDEFARGLELILDSLEARLEAAR